MQLERRNWNEVLGSNLITPTSDMLYGNVVIQRNTRLISESYKIKPRLMEVTHNREFILWYFERFLKHFKHDDMEDLKVLLSHAALTVFDGEENSEGME